MNTQHIKNIISNAIALKTNILENENLICTIDQVVNIVVDAFRNGNKVLLAGNGGSAADAQHIAAELSGKFYFDREPLDAEALHVNTSYLTAVANDYSYEAIYSRAIKAKAKKNDVFFAISTSGNSLNLINALQYCKKNNIITVGLTGETGGKMKDYCDYLINVPSNDTPRIQEIHIMIGHIICELVECILFSK